MKSLIVLRHAKSDHPFGMRDFDRDLTKKGLRDAFRVGEVHSEQELLPELIRTSTAQRARRTTEHVVAGASFTGTVEETPDFYEASLSQILSVVRAIDENIESAMIVGHNPGFWSFAHMFDRELQSFPTAAWARFELNIEFWGELTDASTGSRTHFWYPNIED